MAQLAIAAVGAAVGGALAPGFAFLGLTGASIGWTVGSLIGAQFGPTQRVRGPRLEDLKVTGVEYGQPIPWAAGNPRIAGQIWWASDKQEVATTTDVGKGGGGTEVTEYTYTVDLLIGLLDREISGISRVWSNGKLVWTALNTSDNGSLVNSQREAPWSRITTYTGASTQLPDPTYEAAVGAGNAPAYRGRGSVFIEALQLGTSGQLPNLTFEVVVDGTVEHVCLGYGDDLLLLLCFDGVHGTTGLSAAIDTSYYGRVPSSVVGIGLSNVQAVCASTSFRATTGGEIAYTQLELPPFESGDFTIEGFFYNTGTTDGVFWGRVTNDFNRRGWKLRQTGAFNQLLFQNVSPSGAIYSIEWTFSMPANTAWVKITMVKTGTSNISVYRDGVLLTPVSTSGTPALTIDASAEFRLFTEAFTPMNFVGYAGEVRLFNRALDESEITPDCEAGDTLKVTPANATLQDTVDELCTRAGIPAGLWDSSDLAGITQPVRAFSVAQVTPIRTVLEQLAAAYFFEAHVADKLYFVARGGSSAATVPYADLGAADSPSDADPLPIDQTPDEEIAAQVALTYANADADQTAATEHSDRIISSLVTTAPLQMPLALTSAEAKGIADAMVQDGYAGRFGGTVSLDVRYLGRTPTDVITLTGEDGSTYRTRIVRRTQQGMRTEAEWVSDDATALTSAGITSDDYTPSISVALPGSTTLAVWDIPILRDADDGAGIYATVMPTTATWPGCLVYGAINGGDYSEVASVSSRGVVGYATTALSDFTTPHVFDMKNTVTVDVGNGTLSSTTRGAILAGTADGYVLGAELFYALTATLVSAGVYTLSGLLRGRRGTEHATGTHTIGEAFAVLRSAGLARIAYDAARIGQAADYRAVTRGKTLGTGRVHSITDTGVALKPFAPVQLRALDSGSGSLSVTWKRRTRLSTTFTGSAGSVVPLGEAAEAYEVELYNASAVLVSTTSVATAQKTISSMVPSATLPTGVLGIFSYSSDLWGVTLEGTQYSWKYLVRQTSAGVTVSQLYLGESVDDSVVVGSDFYAKILEVNSSGVVTRNAVHRVDLTAATVTAATYECTALGDYGRIAHDGTYLWASEPATQQLVKLNASTLASVSTHVIGTNCTQLAHLSGDLYFSDDTNKQVVRWSISGTSETWRVSVGGTAYATALAVFGSFVFLACSDSKVRVLNISDGSLAATHDGGVLGRPAFAQLGADVVCYVYVSGTASALLVIDGSTGAEVSRTAPGGGETQFSGVISSGLWFAYTPGGSFMDYDARSYTLSGDLTGYTVKVYQISSTVGRGYPASLTL